MELPLDHFNLIGVSPSSSSEEILRAFQLRLDKTPDEGFTFEVLTQRSELLRLTADLLTNPESRKEYENQVLDGSSGLEFSSNREVAGLMLLWESGSPKEAFKLARQALQPPQTPALGSSREADLTLLAALTSRDAAIQEEDQRCYANASDFLQEGIHILQRMGKLNDLRKNLEDDLVSLLPYRILDYLSRDLSDYESHKKGINMLENFIIKRGGLEGKNKSEYDKFFNQEEFEVFFQQIKPFLTVQEQIDLFLDLQRKGSAEAGFYGFLALTAIGYSQRKPEKLFEAKKNLKNLNLQGLDIMPLQGCIDLLLADVKQAEARFVSCSNEKLQKWFNDYPGENLEAICFYCKNWLENEVLVGYRDIDIENADLDAWFNDREIQEFIEKFENKSTRGIYRGNLSRFGKNIQNIIDDEDAPLSLGNDPKMQDGSNLPLPGGFKEDQIDDQDKKFENEEIFKNKSIEIYKYIFEKFTELKFSIGDLLKNNRFLNKSSYIVYLYVFIILFIFGIGLGFLRSNLKNKADDKSALKTLIQNNNKLTLNENLKKDLIISNDNSKKDIEIYKNSILEIKDLEIKELKVGAPDLDQIKYLLNSWLQSKSRFLEGNDEINLSKIVKKDLIKRLKEERIKDIKKKVIKKISTDIEALEFLSQSSSRISVLVKLKYSEKIIGDNGQLVSETNFVPFLNVKYILGFSNKSWKLVDYISGV